MYGNNDAVPPDTPLTRFLFSKSEFSQENNRVKWRAFQPRPSSGWTSVYRTDSCSRAEVDEIGRTVEAKRNQTAAQKQTLRAYAEVRAQHVFAQRLSLEPSGPERHLDIVGWPSLPEQRPQIQNKAQFLAMNSKLILVAGFPPG